MGRGEGGQRQRRGWRPGLHARNRRTTERGHGASHGCPPPPTQGSKGSPGEARRCPGRRKSAHAPHRLPPPPAARHPGGLGSPAGGGRARPTPTLVTLSAITEQQQQSCKNGRTGPSPTAALLNSSAAAADWPPPASLLAVGGPAPCVTVATGRERSRRGRGHGRRGVTLLCAPPRRRRARPRPRRVSVQPVPEAAESRSDVQLPAGPASRLPGRGNARKMTGKWSVFSVCRPQISPCANSGG